MAKYLIDFKNTISLPEIELYLDSFGAQILETYSRFENSYIIRSDVEPLQSDIVEYIVLDDDNPITLLTTLVVSDTNWGRIATDGSLEMIDIPNDDKNWWKYYSFRDPDLDSEIYTTNRRGEGVTIYVLDSGIEIDHPEFTDAKVTNLFSFIESYEDTAGHGTAIASVMVGKTCGITNATVKSVKIFDVFVRTKQSDMLKALNAIFDDYMTNENVSSAIVNCSWSISKNEYIEGKIQTMIDSGIFFVAASGNSGMPISDVTPASMPDVLTIGSYNNDLKPSDFSNYTGGGLKLTQAPNNSGALDGWAPGEHIYTANLNKTYGYNFGTSIAAGIHSAVLAYNITGLLGNNVDLYLTYSNSEFFQLLRDASLARESLLDLSDPKYSSSRNFISTIYDKVPDQAIESIRPFAYGAVLIANQKNKYTLFNPTKIKYIELFDELPNNCKLLSNGHLLGNIGPLTEKYQIYKIKTKITYIDDTEEETIITLAIKSEDFDKEKDILNEDKDLDILLQGSCGFCYFPGDICADNCTAPLRCLDIYACPGFEKILNYCICANF